jgi:hypothetical protein
VPLCEFEDGIELFGICLDPFRLRNLHEDFIEVLTHIDMRENLIEAADFIQHFHEFLNFLTGRTGRAGEQSILDEDVLLDTLGQADHIFGDNLDCRRYQAAILTHEVPANECKLRREGGDGGEEIDHHPNEVALLLLPRTDSLEILVD